MTVSDLIKKLQTIPPETVVCADSQGKGRWYEIYTAELDFAVDAEGQVVKVLELVQDDEPAYAANVKMFE